MAGLHKAIAQLMEGRQERSPLRTDPPGVTTLLAELAGRVPADDRPLAEAFARELFAKAPTIVLAAGDPAQLAAMAAGAFAFWRAREPAAVEVRAFVPQTDRDGWQTPLTVVECVLDDRPFIVDSICAAIEAAGGELRTLLHPVLGVERRPDGTIVDVGPPEAAAARESFFHAEVARLPVSETLQQELAERLRQVALVTDDYAAMRARAAALAAALRQRAAAGRWDEERVEAAAFVDWLAAKSFVFLGYREYDLRDGQGAVRSGSGLGLLREERRSRYERRRALPAPLRERLEVPPLLLVGKARAESPVHRRVPMDDVTVKEVDAAGRLVGARRLLGLFTSKAYNEAASEIPVLRRRLATILARQGVVEDSHDHRDRVDLFDTFPREELFASTVEDVDDAMRTVIDADPTAGIRVVCHPDALRRGLLAMVLLPRARFSTELHAQVATALRHHLQATVLHEHLALDDRPVARLHFYCAVPADVLARPPLDALQAELDTLLRTWDDELRAALARLHGRNEVERLVGRYGRALPPSYRAGTTIAAAVADIRAIEALLGGAGAQIELAAPPHDGPLALKLYLADEALVLSEFVPVLENLGFRVLGQNVIALPLPDAPQVDIHTFAVELPAAGAAAPEGVAPLVVAALHAVRGHAVENDRLNALVTAAGLDWRVVDVLRAYVGHAQQVGVATRATLIEALTSHPECARRLATLFAVAFDPAASPLPAAERAAGPLAEAREHALAALADVESLAHDRAVRALVDTVAATVRTNFYTAAPGAALALKLDGARVAHVPAPRPELETWVHGVDLHGIHLRAGRVARGGIRASDRPDDLRAEVLGLMRTQVVKNALIVPEGAKGGFVAHPREHGAADPARVRAAYRAFIEALLSITDTLQQNQPVPPPGQVIYDRPDPYLVVAADKGTASFSDLANEIAARQGFWLGDAFASGGSRGYDHKRLGITARGAWECARQHFRDLGRDLDRDTVTVVGIGDMSGDVFGNGLLRSRHLRLLAAFDHREIFLDPDPDPALSYRERERLFALPGSRWSDYAPGALSRGGAVYPRGAKAIALTPEARTLLDLDDPAPSGEDVVRAILRVPADLLWNGGIGTYVKAGEESALDAADPANDAVRVDAAALRVAVVAEGGNLGFTQRARIEYALAGGRIHTDAIDNSGGVDLSDHEVNLKIALQPLVESGELPAPARDALLAELAPAACDAVLAHNRSQALALGVDQERSRTRLGEFRDLISILEAEAGLDRQLAHLPTREALRARRAVYLGLTRPELAVLLANTKLDLRRRLVASPLCDDPALEADLRAYFPGGLAGRHPAAVLAHPLRREIIALQVSNQLVDRMGMTFLVRTVRDTGHDVIDVVAAWAAARAIADAEALAAEIDAARERLHADVERRCACLLAEAVAAATTWLVQLRPAAETAIGDTVERFRAPVARCLAEWPALLDDERRAAHQSAAAELAAAGLPHETAERLMRTTAAAEALEISHIAALTGAPLEATAAAYLDIGPVIELDWLRAAIPAVLAGEDRWSARAAAGLLAGLGLARRQLVRDVLAQHQTGRSAAEALAAYLGSRREQVDHVVALAADVKAASQPSLPALLVLLREIGLLARPAEGGLRA